MEFIDKIKCFLGITSSSSPTQKFTKNENFPLSLSKIRETDEPHKDENYMKHSMMNCFNIFTNPLEIHKYFEQQMMEMMHNFNLPFRVPLMNEEQNPYSQYYSSTADTDADTEDAKSTGVLKSETNLRDLYLKPDCKENKIDNDMDDNNGQMFENAEENAKPKTDFFSLHVTTTSIINDEGFRETRKIVRDHLGNEEITITCKTNEGEHTIIKRKNIDGNEDVI